MQISKGMILGLVALLILIGSPVKAETLDSGKFDSNQALIIQTKFNLLTIDDLVKRDIVTNEVGIKERSHYLEILNSKLGQKLEAAFVYDLAAKYEKQNQDKTGVFNKIAEYISFTNIILFIAATMIALGAGWIFFFHILPLIKPIIPNFVYEIIIYIISSSLINQGLKTNNVYLGLIGCLGLLGGLIYTNYRHEDGISEFSKLIKINQFSLNALILTAAWGYVAIIMESKLIGLLTVASFEAFLGFSVMVLPFCYVIGFKNDQVIPRAMMTSVFLLIVYFAMLNSPALAPYLEIFSKGILYMASFVYFIGLLITSSKYYLNDKDPGYFWMQILTIASGVGAMYIGSVMNAPELRGIGGTFFFLYLIDKYIEIPGLARHWAWGTFIFGLFLYGSAMFMKAHPSYFLFTA